MILCGGFQLGFCKELKCEFRDMNYMYFGSMYTCLVKSLEITHNNINLTENSDVPKSNKIEVTGIYIISPSANFIPANLGSFFNLTALTMGFTHLIEIKSIDFKGMQDLEYLSLSNNDLTTVPMDAFSTLPKLRTIILSFNKIQELPRGLFDNNLKLEQIYFWCNKIKIIGSGLFGELKNLKVVELGENICVNNRFEGKNEIAEMKNYIRSNCTKPNEVESTKTLTSTTAE